MPIHEYNNDCIKDMRNETPSIEEASKTPRKEWNIIEELKAQTRLLEELTSRINTLRDCLDPILVDEVERVEWECPVKSWANSISRDIIQRNERLERSIESLQVLIDRVNI